MKETKEKIKTLLERGVEEIIEIDSLKRKLTSGKKLRVKLGIDPTAPDLHLGHWVVLKKLKQFQDLGHQVIFLIGDYTGMIGDPSGRSEVRPMLTIDELKENEKNYISQAGKVLNIKKVEIRHNSEWYNKKKANFIMEISSKFTYARLVERDDFKKRIKNDVDVSMLELFYPLLQGYDSVELKADVEIGGTDQKFNLLTGRKVQKRYNQPQQDIITVPLLEGTDGVRKMSKSYKNYIAFNDSAKEIFGKVMSLPDGLIWKYYKLVTDIPLDRIKKLKKDVQIQQANPRDLKADLAKEVIKIFYLAKDADQAEQEFNEQFRDKKLPDAIPELKLEKKKWDLGGLLVKTGLVSSKSEARLMIEQGAVRINQKKISQKEITIKAHDIVQVGKRKFVKVK
ncbi:MAG: tyrosine--tRNA ligase [Candidatus Kerfeldbacteria bacterium CG08_land_8_20_14_0_20_40_16]|uniref:Tyrosine--tRNA ligase n=1 Tax=Candidatus Kerfeldbacteria bacterium CG08_land_8_20_14_0_20_40_16 TaxID=2014244 RepID=A0A2H0YWD8_9BACT|nr:MAG: tyrosine--tRNA ligase [Candidatus Kerfeldbacteria bacterium CG08_land_8_20_14_0_20_40_16]